MQSNRPALLFAGALYSREPEYVKARHLLTESFGPVALQSEPFEWDYTSHYEEELGGPISRRFVFFDRLIQQDDIADIKLNAIAIERDLSEEGRRTVNIDPGYLTEAKLVLATTKDYAHRIYLGNGILAELALYFERGKFHPMPHTYRDYADGRYFGLFGKARDLFRGKLS